MSGSSQIFRSAYSQTAKVASAELDRRIDATFTEVQNWRGWKLLHDPSAPDETIVRLIGEIFRAVAWYQPHTTEAGFHMFGRFPKHDVKLLQAICAHKAEEAEHGIWAANDRDHLGAPQQSKKPSPAAFAVAAVWWRIAQLEEPLGYLGAEYLFEQLTALVAPAVMLPLEKRKIDPKGLRFLTKHAVEDQKHALFLKHLIMDVVTRYPGAEHAMYQCFDYFKFVYPLPVWDEAYERALVN